MRQLRSLIGTCFFAAAVVGLSCFGFRAKEAIEAIEDIEAIKAMAIYCAAYGAERLFSLVSLKTRNVKCFNEVHFEVLLQFLTN